MRTLERASVMSGNRIRQLERIDDDDMLTSSSSPPSSHAAAAAAPEPVAADSLDFSLDDLDALIAAQRSDKEKQAKEKALSPPRARPQQPQLAVSDTILALNRGTVATF